MMISASNEVENIEEKWENAAYHKFLISHYAFKKKKSLSWLYRIKV